tara:strand:+ start:3348 stop:4307 length:960 start_codon:yes stop_codon:yes gene_type:complete
MKNIFLIYILIFISIIYLSSCQIDVKEKINKKDFNLSETENIDKIIMSDKAGNIITLEKEKEEWIINSKYPVWKRQIEYTLNVMKDIRIKSSVSEQKTNLVEEIIATTGVKVEIFEGEEKIKSYYIGGNTSDHQGTYMIMENAENAYVMHIPDRHPGILNPKYGIEGIYVNENVWREPIIINIIPKEISEVKVIDFINQEQSFTINIKNKTLADFRNNEILIDNRKYNEFASFFSNLQCGIYKSELNPEDFTLSKKIYITNNNQTDSLIVYDITKIQKTQKKYDSTVENLYAKWNNSEMVIIQKNIFNKVLITLDEIKE